MARSNAYWFEFNGVKSADLGVRLTDAHVFSLGEARGTQEKVSGRSGCVWLSDGANDAFDIKRTCLAPASKLRAVAAWLTGAGGLRFSNADDAMYDARIVKAVEFRRAAPGADPLYEFTVTFSCQPHPRLWPEADPIVLTASGTKIENPGSAPALPRIKIEGTGAFSLTIGKQTMFFSDVSGGIIVDSELMDALTLREDGLANNKIDGDFFEIPPGESYVQWISGRMDEDGMEVAGTINRVTITPRWRML